MATLEPAPRRIYQQRSKLTSLPLYYEGFLWIKRPRSKEVKYWTELRGTKLFLYNDKKHEKFTDTIALWNLKSVTDRHPSQKHEAEVVLALENEEIIIRTEVAEVAEEWKGFILTVSQHSVPTWLTLLPGQIIRLKEVLEKETSRMADETCTVTSPKLSTGQPSPGTYDDVADSNTMPPCYHNVSRQEAAEMLLKNDCGNLILRPGADCKNYAVTIREPLEIRGRAQVKHYKVLKTDRGYTIELDKPVTLNSLHDVVNHFVNETKGKLKPFDANIYDRQIDCSLRETQKNSPHSNVRKLVSQLSGAILLPTQQEMNQAYVNVFPGMQST